MRSVVLRAISSALCAEVWDKFANLYRDYSHGRRQVVLVREEQ
jgi:hypothetical protein